ncbi:hypothetical protein VN97_g6105 [Penicillium thymicola]|uniref:Uncharacterized protein n=1 Tax=Penicillium thymicola TaxID=293382 RepID=A0AAI9TH16_PENTH|nr:hypothetical protein VN97_g6105 [Penicillium thymicola]
MDETGLGLVRTGRDPTAVAHVTSSCSDSNMATLDWLAIIRGRIMPQLLLYSLRPVQVNAKRAAARIRSQNRHASLDDSEVVDLDPPICIPISRPQLDSLADQLKALWRRFVDMLETEA